MTDRTPTVDFDLFAAVTRADSDESWAEPRERCPVAWTEHHGGYWVISGYDEVAAAFRDWEHFSSARTDPEISSIVLGESRLPLLTPEEIDPPDWYPVRRILSELLAPRGAERLRPRAAPLDHALHRLSSSRRGSASSPTSSRSRCPVR